MPVKVTYEADSGPINDLWSYAHQLYYKPSSISDEDERKRIEALFKGFVEALSFHLNRVFHEGREYGEKARGA